VRFRVVVAMCAMFAFGCGGGGSATSGSHTVSLSGAGSTFDNPLFSKAFYQYSQTHPGLTVDYASIGSGAGIEQFTKHTVDFGATDIPMNATELAAYPGGARAVVQVPVALGGVVITYNVPGVHGHLRLDQDALAGIFLGTVKVWNDPAIARSNPGVDLPAIAIVVVHRADGSGTTYIFTDYLSSASPAWKAQVGKGKSVAWKAAASLGAKGNEGVAGEIASAPGAIGYVELAYALATKMNYAALRNKAGAYIVPSMSSVQAAAAQKATISPTDFSIVDPGGAASYPIAGYSWLLVQSTPADAVKGAALCQLVRWLLTDGQKVAPTVDYVPLPSNVSAKALTVIGRCAAGT
jgi:phosphate transport system substrate-binding protein